jgi:hypothetical protein
VDPLTLTCVLYLFKSLHQYHISKKFSSTPFHLLFIILYSSPPCGSTPVLPGYLLLRHSCTWDKTSIFWLCHWATMSVHTKWVLTTWWTVYRKHRKSIKKCLYVLWTLYILFESINFFFCKQASSPALHTFTSTF